MSHPIIGTRGSLLARTQSTWVRDQLGCGELKIISTRGDRLVDLPLQSNLEKGLFTKELEVALINGDVDLAVHSLKDLPVQPPKGLRLAAMPPRAPVADLLILRRGESAQRAGLRVGTSSARRVALLDACMPHAVAQPLRGNVPTRLKKLLGGKADAIILAEAGITRLGYDLADFDVLRLEPKQWTPAPGQGALGLELRQDDDTTMVQLASIADQETTQAVALERAVLERFGGGCHAAVGAFAHCEAGVWTLHIGVKEETTFKVAGLALTSPAPNQVDALLQRFAIEARPLTDVQMTRWNP